MKSRLLALLSGIILILSLCIAGCGGEGSNSSSAEIKQVNPVSRLEEQTDAVATPAVLNASEEDPVPDSADDAFLEYEEFENSDEAAIENLIDSGICFVSVEQGEGDTLAVIPEYSGTPVIVLNGNIPFFSDEDMTTEAFENYSPLDELGRCGTAFANVCTETMPAEERGVIGAIEPSGWHTVKYEGIDGNYLYNRCHLIAYSLAGENANECNLITGTRYLNIISMLPYELSVFEYAKNTGNHVLYRVTPVFQDDDLLANGVLMEAESVEDHGQGICFCVYCYNIQPGIEIDYAAGDSEQVEVVYMPTLEQYKEKQGDGSGQDASSENEETVIIPLAPQDQDIDDGGEATREITDEETDAREQTYILNKNTKRFHYPWCDSVNEMKEKNRESFTSNRQELIDRGYKSCGRCNP